MDIDNLSKINAKMSKIFKFQKVFRIKKKRMKRKIAMTKFDVKIRTGLHNKNASAPKFTSKLNIAHFDTYLSYFSKILLFL